MNNVNDDISVEEISTPRKPRGFAALSPEKRKEIASKGGKAAHAAGTAHQFTREEAIAAGAKGGKAFHRSRGRVAKSIENNEKKVA